MGHGGSHGGPRWAKMGQSRQSRCEWRRQAAPAHARQYKQAKDAAVTVLTMIRAYA
ncbi:hypothetical protein DSM19430T_17330 [Desulfovibrio psychrotolerans]|uniref:Uncharacterized protein n=1 Tax=Desulfovibrio psychrotolerans TaxID=415242 RepID=A0A7J0BTK6_9BACT|nr:hypothetical protein DSM19430T_17330 [Desulfovibrio psychrotolerans]